VFNRIRECSCVTRRLQFHRDGMAKVLLDLVERRVMRRLQRLDLHLDGTLCRVLLSHFRCWYFDFASATFSPTLCTSCVQPSAARCSLIGRRSGALRSSPLRCRTSRTAMPLTHVALAAQPHLLAAEAALQQSPGPFAQVRPMGASISGRRLAARAQRLLVPALRGRR
jgi:hypothetical protein